MQYKLGGIYPKFSLCLENNHNFKPADLKFRRDKVVSQRFLGLQEGAVVENGVFISESFSNYHGR